MGFEPSGHQTRHTPQLSQAHCRGVENRFLLEKCNWNGLVLPNPPRPGCCLNPDSNILTDMFGYVNCYQRSILMTEALPTRLTNHLDFRRRQHAGAALVWPVLQTAQYIAVTRRGVRTARAAILDDVIDLGHVTAERHCHWSTANLQQAQTRQPHLFLAIERKRCGLVSQVWLTEYGDLSA